MHNMHNSSSKHFQLFDILYADANEFELKTAIQNNHYSFL
jgi:hypothetical protein